MISPELHTGGKIEIAGPERDLPPVKTKTRILIVEDHPLVREGLQQMLETEADLQVVGFATSVADAFASVESRRPHLILLDLKLNGGGDTIEFIKCVRSSHPEIRVLVISHHDERIYAERCLRAGADGYITKEEACDEVREALRTVLRGETYVSRKVAVLVFHNAMQSSKSARESSTQPDISLLTDRQLHVFELLGTGLPNREIAQAMNLSVKTVETHREQIKQKMGARSAGELAKLAREWVDGGKKSAH